MKIRRGGHFRGRQPLDFGDFFAHVAHVGRFVAFAPVGCGRQVGAVGFEDDLPQLHVAHDLGQPAFFEGHHAADSEGEIAAGFQFPVGDGILRKGVEHAPQPPPGLRRGRRFLPDDPAHVVPCRTGVDRHRKAEPCGQAALRNESLDLFGDELAAPVVVQPDLPDRNNFRVLRQLLQLCQIIGGLLSGSFGVNAHCRIDVVVAVGKGKLIGGVCHTQLNRLGRLGTATD